MGLGLPGAVAAAHTRSSVSCGIVWKGSKGRSCVWWAMRVAQFSSPARPSSGPPRTEHEVCSKCR